MANIIIFTPKQELDASGKVNEFKEFVRENLEGFGPDFDFSLNQWNVTAKLQKRGHNKAIRFTFSNFDTSGNRKWVPMSEPFLSFAKAKMLYDYGINPRENHSQKMAAIRVLEKSLAEARQDGSPRPQDVTPLILDRAAQHLMEKNPGSAYQSGCHLEILARFLFENGMTNAKYTWKNPIPKNKDLLNEISEEANQYRLKNIPSKSAIRAIPQIYINAVDQRDILISSILAVLFSSPERFNEIFALPVKCEHIDRKPDGSEIFGLRWFTSKGALPEIRKIIQTMKPICKEALQKIREVTKEGRKIAQWYVENPKKLYLPRELEYLRREEYIRSDELVSLIGVSTTSKATRWAGEKGLKAIKVRPRNNIGAPANAYRFRDVEKVICGMLPEGFPVYDKITGLTYDKALLLVENNFFHETRNNCACMFQPVGINTFNDQLGCGAKHGKSSIFSRNNFTEDDLSPIKIDSHDIRHYLTYLGKRKGVDNLMLTLWAGRKHAADTKRYGDPLVEEKTAILKQHCSGIGEELGLIGVDINDPECPLMFQDISQILSIQHQYVHETRFGYCIHDYDTSPCERRAQCLDCCDKHKCFKGLKDKEARIRDEYTKACEDLERLENAIAEGNTEIDQKLHKYLKKRKEIRKTYVAFFDDPNIPNGTCIQFTNNTAPTPLGLAVKNRIALGGIEGKLLAEATTASSILSGKLPVLPDLTGNTP